jgi:integrase
MLLLTAIFTLVLATILGWRGSLPGLDFVSDSFRLLPAFLPCSQSFRPGPAGSDFLCILKRSTAATSQRNTEKMKITVPSGSTIATKGPISQENGQSRHPLKTVGDLMQILAVRPPKQFATMTSAIAAWAFHFSNLPEQRITSPSYNPECPEDRVPAMLLTDIPLAMLYDPQIKREFRPFLIRAGYTENTTRTYVDHIRFLATRSKEISREQETMPSLEWQTAFKLAKANSCLDVAQHFQPQMEPGQVTVKDTDALLRQWVIKDGHGYTVTRNKIIRFWRVLRDAELNSEVPDFLEERPRYGVRYKFLPPDFKASLVAMLTWLVAEWAINRPEKKHLRPASVAGIRATICMLFGFTLTKFPLLTIQTVPDLFTEQIITEYVSFAKNERHVDGFPLRNRLQTLWSAIRWFQKTPKEELPWFKDLMATLPNKQDLDKIKERKKHTRVDHKDLRKIPAKIRAERQRARLLPGTREYALSVRDELCIMWLLHLPWRQKNIRLMRIGGKTPNLFHGPLEDVYEIPAWVIEERKKNEKAEFWQIRFTKKETKMKHGVVAVLPKALVSILEDYLRVRSDLKPARETKKMRVEPETLLLTKQGKTISTNGMLDLVKTLTFRHLEPAKAINPHRFRDLFAYAWLKDNPKDFLTLSKILWHKDVQITIDTYGAEFDIASGVFATETWSAGWAA